MKPTIGAAMPKNVRTMATAADQRSIYAARSSKSLRGRSLIRASAITVWQMETVRRFALTCPHPLPLH